MYIQPKLSFNANFSLEKKDSSLTHKTSFKICESLSKGHNSPVQLYDDVSLILQIFQTGAALEVSRFLDSILYTSNS